MRLIFYFFILLYLSSCQPRRASENDGISIILDYIDSNVVQKKFDIRIYNPPPPPELKDSINHRGSIKKDSIIKNLVPLRIFINDSIQFSKNLIYKNTDSVKGFSFLKNIIPHKKKSFFLDISRLKKHEGIILESHNSDVFFKIYPNIRVENNYGGFLSFQNLFLSKNGKKAYFEVNYFKHRLNTAIYAVFADFKDGKWEFRSRTISIS